MTNVNFSRAKPGSVVKKLSNGDKLGVKILKERVVLTAEVLFVSELGDYNGVTLRLTLDEAKQLQKDLADHITRLETELNAAPPSAPTEN